MFEHNYKQGHFKHGSEDTYVGRECSKGTTKRNTNIDSVQENDKTNIENEWAVQTKH